LELTDGVGDSMELLRVCGGHVRVGTLDGASVRGSGEIEVDAATIRYGG
jgi:hypothetical protein